MLEWPRQAPPDDPGVEGVVRVLDENRPAREVEEGAAGVGKLRRIGDHVPIDLVTPPGIGIDRRTGVNQRVEERERSAQVEALGADLEDEEGPVAGRLDVEGDEVGLLKRGLRTDVGSIDRVLLPLDRLLGAARLEEKRSGFHLALMAWLTSSSSLRSMARMTTATTE